MFKLARSSRQFASALQAAKVQRRNLSIHEYRSAKLLETASRSLVSSPQFSR